LNSVIIDRLVIDRFIELIFICKINKLRYC
jgi:hypothetical protein